MIVRKISDGKVDVSHTDLFCGQWARIQVKRQHVCALTGRVIPIDSLAYRPLTVSRLYRKQRVHISAMEQR